MTEYRLYFLDKAGHFAARFEFAADDDAAALMTAAVAKLAPVLNIASAAGDTRTEIARRSRRRRPRDTA